MFSDSSLFCQISDFSAYAPRGDLKNIGALCLFWCGAVSR